MEQQKNLFFTFLPLLLNEYLSSRPRLLYSHTYSSSKLYTRNRKIYFICISRYDLSYEIEMNRKVSLNLPRFLEFIGFSPRSGTKMFKYKQSSDCLSNWERSSWSCRSLCFGIRFKASAWPFSLLMSTGNRWGQTGPCEVACNMPSHGFGALVGCHLEIIFDDH